MRAVVQRVTRARVRVNGELVGEIEHGLCVLVGVATGDTDADAKALARRVSLLRIFETADGRFGLSVLDTGGAALVVSQFTLIADTRKGNRPSFGDAARPEDAEPVYAAFCTALADSGVPVATGRFGARMVVEIENDGPVTLVLDT